MILRGRKFEFTFPRPSLVMGILNVTPDSFSDGGRYFDLDAAVQRGLAMAGEGAEIIDVGGESSRPGAIPVSAGEELRRILPVIEELARHLAIPISVDTQKVEVAAAAIKKGADIVNDIGGSREDTGMARLVRDTGAAYVLMHMQGTPATMQVNPQYQNVVEEVHSFFEGGLERLMRLGVAREQIIFDIGIGFGKNVSHNVALLAALERFADFHRPLLLGASRKSFISKLLQVEESKRLPGSLACAQWAVLQGVQIIRTHDVAETVQVLRLTEAIRGDR